MAELNGSQDRERSRSPIRDRAPPPRDEGPVDLEPTKLFIGNLSFDTTDRDLEDAFSKFGAIEQVRVITDRDTGRPRGFGFVTFRDQRDADDALAGMQGVELQGREIRVDKSTPRSQGSRGGGGGGGPRGGDRGGAGAGVCYSFQRGDCKYGDSCRFSHEGGGGGGGYERGGDRGFDRRGGYDDRRGGMDDRRGGGYDDRRGGHDRRGGGYDDRRGGGYDDRRGGGYDDRRGGGYDDRRGGMDRRGGGYDDRRGGGADRRGGYDDRRVGDFDDRRGGGRDDRRMGGNHW